MFLITLWEHKRPGGKYRDTSWSVGGILSSTLPHNFGLSSGHRTLGREWALTPEEYDEAMLGVEELHQSGFIRNDPTQGSPEFKALTPKGQKCAEQGLNMKLPSVDIDELLSHEKLRDLVRDDYISGKYDQAIRTAFLHLEEVVRAKAQQPAAIVGHDLMVASFAPGRGVLKHPDAQAPAEHQALFMLFDGANGWLRNPTAHRTVGYTDPHQVAHILGLANLLLELVDKCVYSP
jgi:uncharacterized protein (TIGR02391 family)